MRTDGDDDPAPFRCLKCKTHRGYDRFRFMMHLDDCEGELYREMNDEGDATHASYEKRW